MKLLLLAVLAALALPADAKIGETMMQSILRLGQPDRKDGDKVNATYTWKKENTVTIIQFEKNASVKEELTKDSGYNEKDVTAILGRAAPGAWAKGVTASTFTNGALLATVQHGRIVIGPAPKDVDPAAGLDLEKYSPQQITELKTQFAEEKAAGQKRVYGKIMSVTPEGRMVQCGGKGSAFTGGLFVTGLKDEKAFAVGTPFEALVKPDGTFQPVGAKPGQALVPKAEYVGPIPALSE